MAQVRCNFRQGDEDKAPFRQTGMRQDQARRGHDEVVEEEQIEVERARLVGAIAAAVAPVAAFDSEEESKQGFGSELGR